MSAVLSRPDCSVLKCKLLCAIFGSIAFLKSDDDPRMRLSQKKRFPPLARPRNLSISI
jgi:hypothetical protein